MLSKIGIYEYCSWEGPSIVVLTQDQEYSDKQELMQNYFAEMLSQYCFCKEEIEEIESFLPSKSEKSWEQASVRRTRKRLILENFDFDQRVESLIRTLEDFPDSGEAIVTPKRKNIRSDESVRRSNFIGVIKNGPNWQSLISINRRKTYIGTYLTQNEAARAFDIYSFLLHGLKASTNFPYTKSEILSSLEGFLSTA